MVASLPLPENMDSYEDYSEKIVKVLHLRTEVRGDFNIHGTKYFWNAGFHQKSKKYDVVSLLYLCRGKKPVVSMKY